MDVVWVYGDGGILILPLLLESTPTFIGTFWESLGCSIILSLFFFSLFLLFIYLFLRALLGILNANRKIYKSTDTDVAFTWEYFKVSIFHRERECTN